MDGIHDLGGKHGHGAVKIDDHPVGFVERWHGAVFTMVSAAFVSGAAKNTDHFRHSVERIDPISYLTDTYYGRWLGGIETMLVEEGLITQDELNARTQALGGQANARVAAQPGKQEHTFSAKSGERDASPRRSVDRTARFAIGDRVKTRSAPSDGHTRLPSYVRGAVGTIVSNHQAWVLPDESAHGRPGADYLYNVSFELRDLFGESAERATELRIDLFESYLNHA